MSSSRVRRGPRRVLIVDDSELMRALLRSHIETMHGFEVAGEAANGYEAIRLVHELDPDVVTLDIHMPDLGGADALGYIVNEAAKPVVLVASRSPQLVEPAVSAMLHGAIDFVSKPGTGDAAEMELFVHRLRQAIRVAAMAHVLTPSARGGVHQARHAEPGGRARCAVAIAASTGGPRALAEVLPRLPAELPAAVLVAQHMPAIFTAALARRMHSVSPMTVREASDGEPVLAGVVYIAQGGLHLQLERTADGIVLRLTDEPPLWGVRPAADILFRSVARTYGPASVAVVLTGMGRDGAEGTRAIRDVGGATVCQDAATSVIASMPGAAARYASTVVPLDEVHAAIVAGVTAALGRRGAKG